MDQPNLWFVQPSLVIIWTIKFFINKVLWLELIRLMMAYLGKYFYNEKQVVS